MGKYDVVAIGGVTLDIFMQDEDFKIERENLLCLAYGQKIVVDDVHFTSGGGGANVAVSLKMLGLNSSLLARVGDDSIADQALLRLKEEGVDLGLLIKDKNYKTGLSVALHASGRERTLLLFRGANDNLTGDFVLWDKLKETNWIYLAHLSGRSAGLLDSLSDFLGQNKDIKLAWNPGITQLKQGLEKLKPILQRTEILFLNKEEAEMLGGKSDDYQKVFGAKIVVVTDGAKGTTLYNGQEKISEGTLGTEPVDTIGAGDAFCSGFLAGYINGQNVKIALKWGMLQADGEIQEYGAQRGLLYRQELESKLKK